MRIFESAWFEKFARREHLSVAALLDAIDRAERGLVDADLGGGLIKQRIGRPGAGKSGGYRTILIFRSGKRAVFAFGFAKSDRDNLSRDEEVVFRKTAKLVLAFSETQMDAEVGSGRLKEFSHHDQDL